MTQINGFNPSTDYTVKKPTRLGNDGKFDSAHRYTFNEDGSRSGQYIDEDNDGKIDRALHFKYEKTAKEQDAQLLNAKFQLKKKEA